MPLNAQMHGVEDSVNVDKKKIKKLIKKIKKRPELKGTRYSIKNFDRRSVSFSYPNKFNPKRGFEINVLYKGEVIFIYDIKVDTYELGAINDLR
jgi:hypothetical protein